MVTAQLESPAEAVLEAFTIAKRHDAITLLKTIGVSNYQCTIHLDLASEWAHSLDLIPVDKSIPVTTLAIRSVDEPTTDQA